MIPSTGFKENFRKANRGLHGWHGSVVHDYRDFESGTQESRKGISEIEDKGAMVAPSKRW